MKQSVPLVCCVACLLLAERAAAEISIKLSNQALTTQANVIVIGRAVDSRSRWIDGTLVTAVSVEVRELLKGTGFTVVEVLLPGGIDATRRVPVGMSFPGAPRIDRNEELLLFLTYSVGVRGYVVTGFSQGKFSIITEQGRQMVSRDLRGSQLAGGSRLARGTATLTPLADFRQEIATYLAR